MFLRILHRGLLWRAAVLAGLACAISMPRMAAAQDDRPQIMPGERRPAKKKDTGPRAVGVLRLAKDGKASLVPIAILINGKFWDAGSYKADPIPMALEPGTIYEAEQTGNSLGLFTVGNALHSNAANAPVPWLGTGSWHPTGMEQTTKVAKAESAPAGIEDADAAPRLTRDPTRVKAEPPANSPSGNSTPPSPTSGSDKPKSSGSDEPPRLTKPPSAEPPASSPPAGQNPPPSNPPSASGGSKPSDSKPDASKSDGSKPADAKQSNKENIPTSDSGASEVNRPRLRRGRPEVSFADEEVPGYSKPGAKPTSTADAAKVVDTLAATKGDVQLIPAISDAAPAQMRPFNFDWLKGEEDDRRKQMTALAKDQLRRYIEARGKAMSTAKPARAVPVRHSTPEPILDDVQMTAYDVWRSNQPVMVFTATAHMPPPPAGAGHSEYDSELHYSVLIVAYPDIYNSLHKLYVGVTDKFHLDVTPRLELIDALDADGDGIGELLFRETTDQGTGWAIYRPTADKLWKMYDSLSPEG